MNSLFPRSFLSAFCTSFLCLSSVVVFANHHEETPFPEVVQVVEEKESNENFAMAFTETIGEYNDSYYLQRIHDDAYYHLVSCSASGDFVYLHDASKWEIQGSGRQKVRDWVQAHDIFIKPNAACFSSYSYILHNRTTNEVVAANLIWPPMPMGAYTFRIVNIEPFKRLILLSDNTVWQVPTHVNFGYWQIGQCVLVGVNNNWRTARFPQILINTSISGEPYTEVVFYGYPVGY